MKGSERRAAILEMLEQSSSPVSGTLLGEKFDASRQVIVQDIALLRAAGHSIDSTNRGYVLHQGPAPAALRLVKVRHSENQIEEEMNAIVDLGGTVQDVIVNHRTYGRIDAPLDISSRRDVKRFLEDLETGVSSPLSRITDGYHFHHISAESEEVLDEIVAVLDKLGFLAPLTEYEASPEGKLE